MALIAIIPAPFAEGFPASAIAKWWNGTSWQTVTMKAYDYDLGEWVANVKVYDAVAGAWKAVL